MAEPGAQEEQLPPQTLGRGVIGITKHQH